MSHSEVAVAVYDALKPVVEEMVGNKETRNHVLDKTIGMASYIASELIDYASLENPEEDPSLGSKTVLDMQQKIDAEAGRNGEFVAEALESVVEKMFGEETREQVLKKAYSMVFEIISELVDCAYHLEFPEDPNAYSDAEEEDAEEEEEGEAHNNQWADDPDIGGAEQHAEKPKVTAAVHTPLTIIKQQEKESTPEVKQQQEEQEELSSEQQKVKECFEKQGKGWRVLEKIDDGFRVQVKSLAFGRFFWCILEIPTDSVDDFIEAISDPNNPNPMFYLKKGPNMIVAHPFYKMGVQFVKFWNV